MAKVIQVIEVETTRGHGKDASDPLRRVMQYWSFDGELLAEDDPHITNRPTSSIERGASLLREPYPSVSGGAIAPDWHKENMRFK